MEDEEDLPLGNEFEAETITRALGGDDGAGKEALQFCIVGLYANRLSESMRFYLARCLTDVVDGMKPERALNIEVERAAGRPKDPFPDWEMPLAALAALLVQRGQIAARVEEAMDAARQELQGKSLDPRDARRIRDKYSAMEKLDPPSLIDICEKYGLRGNIRQFFPEPDEG